MYLSVYLYLMMFVFIFHTDIYSGARTNGSRTTERNKHKFRLDEIPLHVFFMFHFAVLEVIRSNARCCCFSGHQQSPTTGLARCSSSGDKR